MFAGKRRAISPSLVRLVMSSVSLSISILVFSRVTWYNLSSDVDISDIRLRHWMLSKLFNEVSWRCLSSAESSFKGKDTSSLLHDNYRLVQNI